ncbi:MAG: F0F1 ATP synthase subunit B [Candidatus Altiarchaeota archaeon]|nr:F0F1 ATP synthase subunit B [Candidatus Altiarchaeota archaeon]
MKRLLFTVLVFTLIPAVVYASGGGEAAHESNWGNLFWRVLNFTILAAVLYKFTAKAIVNFFVGDRASIKSSLDGAVAAKEEAERKLVEHSARLDKAAAEIEGIADMIRAQGLAEKEKIIEEAKRTAEKMKEDAEARVDQEFKRALHDLRKEATELSVTMAGEILERNIKAKDHENMVNDFLDRMVSRN